MTRSATRDTIGPMVSDSALRLKVYLARAIAGEQLSDAAVEEIAKKLASIDPDYSTFEGNETYFRDLTRAILKELTA